MPNNNHAKGAKAERDVARYLRSVGFPLADRRLREGRRDDQGDIDGVPFTVIQVKHVEQKSLQTWMTDTLKQRDAAGVPLCVLVVRKLYKRPEGWDAYMPFGLDRDERESWTWVRMDLRLAVELLRTRIAMQELGHSGLSLSTTSMATWGGPGEILRSVPSTARDEPV